MNGINVIRYGTEIHKMGLSQKFYDLRVMSVMRRANIRARCIISLIETKLRLPSELRLTFRRRKELTASLYLQIFQSPKWRAARTSSK